MKFVICGDFVSQDPKRIQVDQRLLNLLKSADYVAVNFEAPVRGVGKTIYKSGPALTQSLDSPAFIENLGANIIMLANNHMMDQDMKDVRLLSEHSRRIPLLSVLEVSRMPITFV